jgi:hypothetical protein
VLREDRTMNSIMRRTVRGAATGLGALALITGASACGMLGGGDEGGEEPSVEQPAEDVGADDGAEGEESEGSEDAESSEDGESEGEDATTEDESDASGTDDAEGEDAAGDEAAGPVDQAGLDAASQRFVDFIQVMDDGDGEAACAFFIDPTTDEPVAGETLTQCGEMIAPQMEAFEPGSMDIVDVSMVEATDNGDGTVGISLGGSEFPYSMSQGEDGEWYMLLS